MGTVVTVEAVNEVFFKLEDAIHSARRQQEPCMNEELLNELRHEKEVNKRWKAGPGNPERLQSICLALQVKLGMPILTWHGTW